MINSSIITENKATVFENQLLISLCLHMQNMKDLVSLSKHAVGEVSFSTLALITCYLRLAS